MHERRNLIIAVAVTLLLYFLPIGTSITYPFLIFATFIHESSHALMTVVTGGHVDSLTVALDGSGLTYSEGGFRILISSAGYLGTAVFGGLLLILSARRRATRATLMGCAILIAAITSLCVGHASNVVVLLGLGLVAALCFVSAKRGWRLLIPAGVILSGMVLYLWITGSLFSWFAGILITGVLLFVARGSEKVAHLFLTFLSVQCLLNSVESLKTLFVLSVNSNVHSDAQNMAAMTGIPAVFWAMGWTLIAVAVLLVSGRLYYLQSKKESPAVTAAIPA